MSKEYWGVIDSLIQLASTMPDEAAGEIRKAVADSLAEEYFKGQEHRTTQTQENSYAS